VDPLSRAHAGRLRQLTHGRDFVRKELRDAPDKIVARLRPVAAHQRRAEMVPHRGRLRREEEPVDAGILHALELSVERSRERLVADLELGAERIALLDNLPRAVSEQLHGSGSVMRVRVDDHAFTSIKLSRKTRSAIDGFLNERNTDMPDIPRLNGVIKALEAGQTAFVAFTPVDAESAIAMAASELDGVAFEMEHSPLDFTGLRSTLQFMLDRREIVERNTLTPKVTPLVRIPPNGNEMNQWIANQVLDIGVFGIIFPHISTMEAAWNAVGACRYPRLQTAPIANPPGIRGDAPQRAARYWGLTQQEYYKRADVWPLAPDGEVLVIIQCEDMRAIDNLPRILKEV